MIEVNHDKESDIIKVDVTGVVDSQEIIKALRYIGEQYGYLKRLFVISDYSKGQIKPNPSFFLVNITNVKERFIEYFSRYDAFYNAYITDPEDATTKTILMQFLSLTSNLKNFNTGFFDSLEEAKEWLQEKQKAEK